MHLPEPGACPCHAYLRRTRLLRPGSAPTRQRGAVRAQVRRVDMTPAQAALYRAEIDRFRAKAKTRPGSAPPSAPLAFAPCPPHLRPPGLFCCTIFMTQYATSSP